MRSDFKNGMIAESDILEDGLVDKGKTIIPNEERRKFGLAPIPGGEVAITRISDSNTER